jgi:hypothetical protein
MESCKLQIEKLIVQHNKQKMAHTPGKQNTRYKDVKGEIEKLEEN